MATLWAGIKKMFSGQNRSDAPDLREYNEARERLHESIKKVSKASRACDRDAFGELVTDMTGRKEPKPRKAKARSRRPQ